MGHFFSFTVRNYAHKAYGDELDRGDDNPEEDAFETETRNDGSSYRFEGIGYAESGNPSYAAFACYLWSLYDSYSGGSFEVAKYAGDNENVRGLSSRVFKVYRLLPDVGSVKGEVPTVAFYRDVFKEGGTPYINTELRSKVKTSVSSVGTFMMSDYTDVPDSPMPPPQLTDASGQIKSDGDVSLQWTTRSYPAGRNYGNYPDGYRLYKDGSAVAIVASGTSTYTYDPNGTSSGTYRLTAYNAAGEARGGSSIILGVEVSIFGSSLLNSGEEGAWTASASRPGGSISYSWEVKQTWSSTWSTANCYGTSCSHSFINTCEATKTAQVRVIATRQTQADTASQTVSVSGSGGTLTAGDVQLNAPPCPSEDPDPIAASKADQGAGIAGISLQAKPAEGREVLLSWQAGGSAPQAPMTVQHRTDSTATWADLGVVRPADSVGTGTETGPTYQFQTDRLDPGPHQFRLAYAAPGPGKQSMRTSRVVTATVEMNEVYRLLTYPNPVRERATVELAVKEQQEVTVRVYDVLGRQVTTLHEGSMRAQDPRRLSLDAAGLGLSSGTYVVRARGESFVTTKRLTVVR